MGDTITPSTLATMVSAALALAGTVITGWLLRGNTRLNARLQEQSALAQRLQEQEEAERTKRLDREQQLDTQTQWLLAQYKADIEELRKQLDSVKQEYQKQLDALRAENADLKRRIVDLEHVQRAGGGTAAAS